MRSELHAVRDALVGVANPWSLLSNWNSLASHRLLVEIAQGRLELSHEALDARVQTFSVNYLRSVLVAAGALAARDENTARLHRYIDDLLVTVADGTRRGVLSRYARWHVAGRAQTNRHGHLSSATIGRCKGEIAAAKGFLDYLVEGGRDLDDCPQACLDAWLSGGRDRRIRFIRWLTHNGWLAHITLPEPVAPRDPRHEMDPDQQLALARRLLHEVTSASIEDRAAACLVLLYAQPLAKIVTLTSDDVQRRGADTYLKLGPEPLLLIPPLDALITALPVVKPFGTAHTLADRRWLFTGKNAGSHIHPASLMRRMQKLGIIGRMSRNTAMLILASRTPPAVFADLIGVDIETAVRWAELAGAKWSEYVATR